ncbi:hypothetical protein BD770DRAFT_429836 [Pilaira anomala]|nr:hypothetical protein BD770DRAFT_429836 [Pilaira anomala]
MCLAAESQTLKAYWRPLIPSGFALVNVLFADIHNNVSDWPFAACCWDECQSLRNSLQFPFRMCLAAKSQTFKACWSPLIPSGFALVNVLFADLHTNISQRMCLAAKSQTFKACWSPLIPSGFALVNVLFADLHTNISQRMCLAAESQTFKAYWSPLIPSGFALVNVLFADIHNNVSDWPFAACCWDECQSLRNSLQFPFVQRHGFSIYYTKAFDCNTLFLTLGEVVI